MIFHYSTIKKPLIYSMFIALLSACSFASADSSLSLQEDISLLAINGKSTEKNKSLDTKSLRFTNGTHQILVRYTAEIEAGRNDTTYEDTDTFVITFTEQNQNLYLESPDIRNIRELKQFNKNPAWVMRKKNGDTINITVAPLLKEGIQFARNYEQELQAFNQTASPAALPALSVYTPAVPVNTHQAVTTKPISNSTAVTPQVTSASTPSAKGGISYGTLVELYQQASPSVQQQFTHWLKQQAK